MKIIRHVIYEPCYIAVKLITDDGLGIIEYTYNKSNIANICNFSVENSHCHLGIGTFLLKAALSEIKKLGKNVCLLVNRQNKELQRWYNKYGFKEDSFYSYEDEFEEKNYIYMIKRNLKEE